MNSEQKLTEKLEETWNFDQMRILREARLGDSKNLKSYLEKFSPLAAANDDYSVLLTLRQFDISQNENQKTVLNAPANHEDFQWGISIATSSEAADAKYNIFLPNNYSYSGLRINDEEVEILIENHENIKTNVAELHAKLQFWDDFSEKKLEEIFDSLSDLQYDAQNEKPKVENLLITIPCVGPLVYNEDFEWYEGIFTSDEIAFDVNVYNTTPEKLDGLVSFVESQIQSEFYKKMLLEIESEMIKLKNQNWREVNEITTEKEPKITAEDFRNRVSIDSIIFNDDCSSQIYCHDDDIFWGHQIQINVDKNGKYKSVDLVG